MVCTTTAVTLSTPLLLLPPPQFVPDHQDQTQPKGQEQLQGRHAHGHGQDGNHVLLLVMFVVCGCIIGGCWLWLSSSKVRGEGAHGDAVHAVGHEPEANHARQKEKMMCESDDGGGVDFTVSYDASFDDRAAG